MTEARYPVPQSGDSSVGRPHPVVPPVAAAVVADAIEVTLASDVCAMGGWYVTSFDMDTPEEDGFWNGQVNESGTTLDSWPAVFVGPPASDSVMGVQDYSDDYPHDDDPEDPWHANVYGFPDQAMDVVAALFPPEPDSTYAAQPHYGDDFSTYVPEETADYAAIPEQNEPFAPPEVLIPELLAAQPHFGEWVWDAEQTDDYANESSLDVSPQFFPPIVVDADEVVQAAAQLGEQPWFPDAETEDYHQPPEQNEAFAPPEAVVPELLAAQYGLDPQTFAEDLTEDYSNDSTLDVVGPFIADTPVETHAAQPLPHDIYETLTPEDTTDYVQPPESNEPFAPPEIVVPELIAAQPLGEQPWFPEQEQEDYGSDTSLDVSPLTFPAQANTDEEYQAASQLPEHDAFTLTPEETSDYAAPPEQNEWLAPPEVSLSELMAAQPHYGELPIPETETEDYANDTALEPPRSLVPPEVSLTELLASQPLSEHFWAIPDDTEDYQKDATLDVAPLSPAVAQEPDSTFAAQPHFGEYIWPDTDTEDYQPEVSTEFIATLPTGPTDGETAAIIGVAEQPWFGEQETEDFQPELDVAAAFAPTPDETHVAQPLPHDLYETLTAEETQDYQPELDALPAVLNPPLAVEVIAAQPHYGEWLIEPEVLTIEDGHVSTLEVPALIPVPSGLGEVRPITKEARYTPNLPKGAVYGPIAKRASYTPSITKRAAYTPSLSRRAVYRPLLA